MALVECTYHVYMCTNHSLESIWLHMAWRKDQRKPTCINVSHMTQFPTCSVSHLCQCGVLSADNSVITLKVLPTLVRLCKAPGDVPVNTRAAHTLGKGSDSDHGLCICGSMLSPCTCGHVCTKYIVCTVGHHVCVE